MNAPGRPLLKPPLLAVCAAVIVVCGASHARPLTEDACERYASERAVLDRLGVKAQLSHGAEWARVNLTEPQLDLIHRYIRLEEALTFRCPESYANKRAEPSQEPRRLDVIPPVPGRKPVASDTGRGVTETTTVPPPPTAKAGRDRG
jgi:hypothetical protein